MRLANYIFTYLLGLIFLVGGVLFVLFLDDNRLLFGIPYVVIGLLLVVGAHMGLRRRARAAREDGA